jgi:hypothetical protein
MNHHYEPVACFDLTALTHAEGDDAADASDTGGDTSLAGRLVLLVTRTGIELTEVPRLLH